MNENMDLAGVRRQDWRDSWAAQTKAVIKTVENLPETITIPLTTRKTIFEFGSAKRNYGFAMIVSDARCYPSQGRTTPKLLSKEYSLQAEITVWAGCLIGIASHNLGKETMAIYEITDLTEAASPTSFGSVTAKLIAYVKGSNYSGSSRFSWYDNLIEKFYCIPQFVSALKTKLYSSNTATPHYVEMFVSLKNPLHMRRQFFNSLDTSKGEWMWSGILDVDANCDVFNTFDDFYNAIIDRAIYLRRQKVRIVMVMIAHYFAKYDEEKHEIIYVDNEELNEETLKTCRLVSEARIFMTDKYKKDEPMHLDDIVFSYIHKFDPETPFYRDEENKKINSYYFVSDATFREFAKKHQYDYVNCILDRHFYQDILHNLHPEPYPATHKDGSPVLDPETGEQVMNHPKPKTNPDTQTNALLFISSCHQYFFDKKQNYADSISNEDNVVVGELNENDGVNITVNGVNVTTEKTGSSAPLTRTVVIEEKPSGLDMSGLDSLVANHHN